MVGLISIIIIIVISFVMMMEGWEKYDSQKFYTKGERYDKEGFMHLSAVCWNAIALLYYDKHNKGLIEWKDQEK
jgi:hypothetical protein